MRQFKARNVAGTEEGLGFSTRAQTVATEALIGGYGTSRMGVLPGEGSGPHGRLRREILFERRRIPGWRPVCLNRGFRWMV